MEESKPSQLKQDLTEEKFVPFSEGNQKIQKSLTNLFSFFKGEKLLEVYEEVSRHAKLLREKYPDCNKRVFYHILIGSSLSSRMGPIIEDDFPGEDSVEKFIENLTEKYQK